MPTHSLKARALMLCLAFALTGAAAAHAGGQAEPRLADAEKLIEQQDYTGALKMLTAIQRKDPNLRDQTGRLMAVIMAVTVRYNAVLEELNKAIEAGDVPSMETLISELERIDPVRAAGISGRAKVLAQILGLMIRAKTLLTDGKTTEALSLYLLALTDPAKAGVTLPQGQFEGAGSGDIFAASVRRLTADIVATTQNEVNAAADIPGVLPAAKALLAGGSPAASNQAPAAQLERVTGPLLQAAAAEGTVRARAAALSDIGSSIQQGSGGGREDLYLLYLRWISLGRQSQQEGIADSLRLLWADDARSVAEAASGSAVASFESARSQYEQGALAAADAAFQEVPGRSFLAAKASALLSARFDVRLPAGNATAQADASVLKSVIAPALAAQEYSAEAAGYRVLINSRNDLDSMPAAGGSSGAASGGAAGGGAASLAVEPATLVSARASLGILASEARAQEQQWTDTGHSWEAKEGVLDGVAPLAESALYLASLFQGFVDTDVRSRDLAYGLRLASLGGATFTQRLDSAMAMRAKAEDLKDGTINGQIPPGTGLAVKHPDQALEVFAAAGKALDALAADILAHEQKLQGEKDYVKADPAYAALFAGSAQQPGYDSLLQGAQAERTKIDTLTASSQQQVDNAALLSREGDNFYNQALAALKQNDPDVAISSITTATDKYVQSLAEEYSDHAAQRTSTDAADVNNRIGALQARIAVNRAQKDYADINKLIDAGNFLGASDALDDARRRWSQSGQADTYPPFENLRQNIQTAVEVSQGRDLSRVDPKADVINTLIKNAQDNLAAGKLTEASQNVRDALAVAPNYGAAKVLALQIKKQTDPEGFQRDALDQIATYTKMVNSPNARDQRTAYNALLDYSKLDPKFAADTRGTIQELKYVLKIVPRPPTAQQIAQAHALVQRADALQQQGTPEAYQGALDLLQQALKLNPSAQGEVIALDAAIREKIGSTAPVALSPADAQVYNLAYSEFLSGAYQDAYDKVLSIWNGSPRNKSYAPLQRLKKRLEVQLNIS